MRVVAMLGLMAIVLLSGCGETAAERPRGIPADWKLYHARKAFTFWGPADLQEENLRGIDSYVGRYTSVGMTVEFDYGMFSGEWRGERYKPEEIELDGRKAVLVRWEEGVGLFVGKVHEKDGKDGLRLSMGISCKPKQAKEAEMVLRSVRFGTSTNRNGE